MAQYVTGAEAQRLLDEANRRWKDKQRTGGTGVTGSGDNAPPPPSGSGAESSMEALMRASRDKKFRESVTDFPKKGLSVFRLQDVPSRKRSQY